MLHSMEMSSHYVNNKRRNKNSRGGAAQILTYLETPHIVSTQRCQYNLAYEDNCSSDEGPVT